MDKERRGLSTALSVTSEIEEFVRPGKTPATMNLVEESPSNAESQKPNIESKSQSSAVVEEMPSRPKTVKQVKARSKPTIEASK